jgi:NADPH:quinone reductase
MPSGVAAEPCRAGLNSLTMSRNASALDTIPARSKRNILPARRASPKTGSMKRLTVSALAPDYAGCALSEAPMPEPGPGQVRVKVAAAAINFPDLLMTRGEYQLKPELPFSLGMECAGKIDAVGTDVTPEMAGRAVVAGTRLGAMADYVCVDASAVRAKPERLTFAEASAYGSAYLTAWVSLVRRAQIQPGEWLLVHGAAGGMGLAAVDLGQYLDARVIAASASAAKREAIDTLYGPDAVIDSAPGFRESVLELTGGKGADVVFDPVGGDVFDESARCTAFDGKLLVVGFASGRISSINANIPLIKGFSVVGVRAGEYGRRFPERGAENMSAIDELAANGAIRPHVHAELPLNQWREAFRMIEDREVVGKLVLVPDQS